MSEKFYSLEDEPLVIPQHTAHLLWECSHPNAVVLYLFLYYAHKQKQPQTSKMSVLELKYFCMEILMWSFAQVTDAECVLLQEGLITTNMCPKLVWE